MVGNIVLLSCGFAGGFILGFMIAAELGRQIYNRKMKDIRNGLDVIESKIQKAINEGIKT